MSEPNELARLISDLEADPRHFLTRRLLDAIAALWRDEDRINLFTLDFHAAAEFELDDPMMTWAAYPKRAQSEFAEFMRIQTQAAEQVVELTPEAMVRTAEMNVQYAQERAARARRDLAEAHKQAARALAGLDAELGGDNA